MILLINQAAGLGTKSINLSNFLGYTSVGSGFRLKIIKTQRATKELREPQRTDDCGIRKDWVEFFFLCGSLSSFVALCVRKQN